MRRELKHDLQRRPECSDVLKWLKNQLKLAAPQDVASVRDVRHQINDPSDLDEDA